MITESKKQQVALIRSVVIIGFALAIFFHYICGFYLKMPYPYYTFLFTPTDRFADFFNTLRIWHTLSPAIHDPLYWSMCYLPFAYIIVNALSAIHPWGIPFCGAILVFLASLAAWNWKYLCSPGDNAGETVLTLFAFTCLPYPVLFLIDRGNFDLIVFALIVAFLLTYQRQSPWLSACCLAAAIAMKGYPILFLLLAVAEKKPRFILLVLSIAVALTVSSWAIMDGPLLENMMRTFTSLSTFMEVGVRHGTVMRFNISLFSAIALISPWRMALAANANFLLIYSGACLCAICALALYLVKVEHVFWRRVSLIIIAMLLLPHASGDYRLVFMIIPLGLYLSDESNSRYDFWYWLLFGCLLIPKNYLVLGEDQNIGMLLNPLLLLTLATILVRNGYAARQACKLDDAAVLTAPV